MVYRVFSSNQLNEASYNFGVEALVQNGYNQKFSGDVVYDVAVDVRNNSQTFGQWEGVVLSEENKTQFWIPPGFAHGFVVLSHTADFEYKCTDYYDPSDEGSLLWNDPELNISWPNKNPKLSEKDANANKLFDLKK